jgi:hypothetical protein
MYSLYLKMFVSLYFLTNFDHCLIKKIKVIKKSIQDAETWPRRKKL